MSDGKACRYSQTGGKREPFGPVGMTRQDVVFVVSGRDKGRHHTAYKTRSDNCPGQNT